MNTLYELLYNFWSSFFPTGGVNSDLLELVALVSVFVIVIGLVRLAVKGLVGLVPWRKRK